MNKLLIKYDFDSSKQVLHQRIIDAIAELMQGTNTKHIEFSHPLPSIICGDDITSEVHRSYIQEINLDDYNNLYYYVCDSEGNTDHMARYLERPSEYIVPCDISHLYDEIWEYVNNIK